MADRQQLRFLSQASQLEETVAPRILSVTITTIVCATLAFVGWAAVTDLSVIARTSGEVVPRGFSQTVQHLEGGIVKAIHVEDGDLVSAGDVLVELHSATVRDELESARARLRTLAMDEERLRAFVEGRAPAFDRIAGATSEAIADNRAFYEDMISARAREGSVIERQIAQRNDRLKALRVELATAKQNVVVARDIHDRRLALEARGLSSTMALLEDKRRLNDAEGRIARLERDLQAAEAEIDEFEERLKSLRASHRDKANEALSTVISDIISTRARIETLSERRERLAVTAPVDGVIKGLTVNTLGAVVAPGATLMEIVPVGRDLELLVEIDPQDVGHLDIGMPVNVKVTGFDFTRYGIVPGTLVHVSATSFEGSNGQPVFRGRVQIEQASAGARPILPGMTATADIITGEKTVLRYLLRPIQASLHTAMTER